MARMKRSHRTKSVRMDVQNGNTSKRAGSNRLTITVQSDDWRIQPQTISMTIRDAQALRSFLNNTLE